VNRSLSALPMYLAFAVTIASLVGLAIDLTQTAYTAARTAHTVVLVAAS
jgi:hypothetical protein